MRNLNVFLQGAGFRLSVWALGTTYSRARSSLIWHTNTVGYSTLIRTDKINTTICTKYFFSYEK
jgi:hypothetical protein